MENPNYSHRNKRGNYRGKRGNNYYNNQDNYNKDYNNYNNYNNNYNNYNNYNNKYDYEDNSNYYNDNNNNYNQYYSHRKFKRKNDNFTENIHSHQMEKKREYKRKKYNEEKEKREEKEEQERIEIEKNKMNIDPNYNREEIRIKEKLLDISLKKEEEENKEKNELQRQFIKQQISDNYDSHIKNLESISKKERNESQNIFKEIILKNEKLKSNQFLIFNILETIKNTNNAQLLENQLVDLLGYDEIETVSELIQNLQEIRELIKIAQAGIEEKNDINKQQENLRLFGVQFVEKKQKKKKLTELQQAQEENFKILEQLGFSRNFLNFFEIEYENEENENENEDNINNPIKLAFGDQVSDNIKRDKENYITESIKHENYIEVKVKPILKERKKVDLINVKEKLPEYFHKCFNFNLFNEIQSTVFNKAFNSDENLLIAAPTGAGKTNIALITILREINKELRMKNLINLDKDFDFSNITWDFKILYLVPLKALANEIVNKFNYQLKFLNIITNEFSGDVNLSREQIEKTNLFIGIPEKWDLFTRKHDEIFERLKLMIIDEIHLLNEDRGRVLECIVARTIRKSELNQKFVRLTGLSATLPNYNDVADFLRVKEGLFAFDSSYRATPLQMSFFGLSDLKFEDYNNLENNVTYEQIVNFLKNDKQVLVFVHSRFESINFADEILKIAEEKGDLNLFIPDRSKLKKYSNVKISNKKIESLIEYGIGFHNAGILRKDRTIIENLFREKLLKVLVSTSTLAWGVNLPAYACIIKGTRYYDASSSDFKDIGILDIQQMFGRAGRPQYDNEGVGIIISPFKKMSHYVLLLKDQLAIESSLPKFLADALNAEIAIGNISNINDAINWVKLTYFGRRLTGANRNQNLGDLKGRIINAFKVLNNVKLIRYIDKSGQVHSTDLGRIASNYYMSYKSIDQFNKGLKENMTENSFLGLLAKSEEFINMKIYEEEKRELNDLARKYELISGNSIQEVSIDQLKPIILLYTYLHGDKEFKASSLFIDSAYIIDNSPRILRAMVEICLHKHLINTTFLAINYMKFVERRVAPRKTPLWQLTFFSSSAKLSKNSRFKYTNNNNMDREGYLKTHICEKLDNLGKSEINDILKEDKVMLSKELNLSIPSAIELIKFAKKIPQFHMKVEKKPLTRTILNITVTLTPKFYWSKKFSHESEPFLLTVNNEKEIIHHEQFSIIPKQNKKMKTKETVLTFAVPFDIQPGKREAHIESIYTVTVISERWIGSTISESFYLHDIEVPDDKDIKTELLNLYPLPLSALQDKNYEKVFSDSFKFFNPVQTQIFYSVYHTDENLLIGAPTGSGKTVIAELAMLRLFKKNPTGKIIYIAPLKSLAKERVLDWRNKFSFINKNVLELTGDFTPDIESLLNSDILITTPEKWDGISRNWHQRAYVKKVSIVIIDEIHLLGLERGPVIEVIVSRMRFISHKLKSNVRFIGLSTALANSSDVAEWLGISLSNNNKKAPGLFNFKPAVRPCPVTIHIEGFNEKRYCPRMATMNKPCYNAVINFSDNKPVLIFVSSRRQTRLTALDLISLSANHSLGDYSRNSFLNVPINEIENDIDCIYDENLKHTLSFGIGMHHAGLVETDRKIVERLFLNQKIQILIATSTLAWGVNFPAHLVIIKGTEYYHPKLCTYVDMPITDILQMIGRAGRPQYDDDAVACLFVKQDKKNFYKKFLYEPFPLESSLHKMLFDHINAEISSGMLTTKNLCIEYIRWTYFFKRLVKNPTFYGLTSSTDAKTLNNYLNNVLNNVLDELHKANCIEIFDGDKIHPTDLGNLTSFYYMSYKSAKFYYDNLKENLSIIKLLDLLSKASEFDDVPVRHNEESINEQLSSELPIKLDSFNYGSSHTKTNLLIQAHFSRIPMPISDYKTDLKTVLDNCIRILLFMADISFKKKYLDTTLNILTLIQMVMQGLWENDCSLKTLPYIDIKDIRKIYNRGNINHICELCEMYHSGKDIKKFFTEDCGINSIPNDEMDNLIDILSKLPILDVSFKLYSLDSSLKRIYNKPIIENSDCQIRVHLKKNNDIKNNLIVYSLYGKIKSCRWFIIIGNIKTNEILVFEKVSFKEKIFRNISFIAPKEIDNDSLVLYIISDSYFGLDQQYNIRLLDINKGIMDKFGIIEVKNNNKEFEKEDKDDNNNSQSDDDVETKKDENEQEDDIFLENW